ncbi:hypothetical protein BDR22DRAFT_849771, partial [Usnea florida]
MKLNSEFKRVAVCAANGECSSNGCEGGWGAAERWNGRPPHPAHRGAYESLDYWWQTSAFLCFKGLVSEFVEVFFGRCGLAFGSLV